MPILILERHRAGLTDHVVVDLDRRHLAAVPTMKTSSAR
jgi:hypothetical protein